MDALMAWRPFREFERMRREMERNFSRIFEGWPAEEVPAGYYPRIESFMREGNIMVQVDLPGIDLKELKSAFSTTAHRQGPAQGDRGGKGGGLFPPRTRIWSFRTASHAARRERCRQDPGQRQERRRGNNHTDDQGAGREENPLGTRSRED